MAARGCATLQRNREIRIDGGWKQQMKVRKLKPEEHILTRPLYEEAFSQDSQSFTDYDYTEKTVDNQIYVLEEDGKICSMVHLNPYTVSVNGHGKEMNYIVAVATKTDCRRRGYMAAILRQALHDMYKAGELFTFLMPASEKIYEPFDFRTVYEQNRPYVREPEGWDRAEESDCEEIAAWAQSCLCEKYQVYVVRNAKYYRRMRKEYESDGGKLLITRNQEGQITNFGIWVPEENPGKEKIMIRILDVRRMLMSLKLTSLMSVCFTVEDPILEENNRCLVLTGTEFSGVMLMDAKQENSEGSLTIRALTDLVFGIKPVEEVRKEEKVKMTDRMAGELEKIIPLSRIYLNEVV